MKKLIIFFIVMGCLSCGDGFLDVKPSSNTVVPTTLDDFEQLLNYGNLVYAYPDMLDVLADDYYLEELYWKSRSNVVIKNAYVWADDIYETRENDLSSWEKQYTQIFYANVVIEGLAKITLTDKNKRQYQQIQGAALFLRAWALYNIAQLYAPAYNESTASIDLAVPIPLKSDVNEKVRRNSVAEVYERILMDIEASAPLVQREVNFGHPSKAAVYALQARVLLAQAKYPKALVAAKNSILAHDALIDLNSKTWDYKKTLFMAFDPQGPFLDGYNKNIQIVHDLYRSYASNDLRLKYYSLNNAGKPYMKDIYIIGSSFRGLDTDEQYLIKAECEARLGDKDESMRTINHLLKHVHHDYSDKAADSKEEALAIILEERRKQLVFRGLRWSDLKRYNRDGAAITLTRVLGDKTYTLEPNSPKWLMPLPTNEIKTSGIPQNMR